MSTCDSCTAGGDPIHAGVSDYWCEGCGNGFCVYCAETQGLDDPETIYCDGCYEAQNTIARSKQVGANKCRH